MTPLKIPEISSPGFFDSGSMRISDLRNRASNASDNFEFTSRGGFTRRRRAQRSAYFCTNGLIIVVAFLLQLGLMRSEISDAPGDVSPLRYQSVLRPRLFFCSGGITLFSGICRLGGNIQTKKNRVRQSNVPRRSYSRVMVDKNCGDLAVRICLL